MTKRARETRHILRTWYKALQNPNEYWNKHNLKWLYTGLKNVPEEDRLLLAFHYLSDNGRPLTNAAAAEQKDMSVRDYNRMRKAAEMRLCAEVQPLIDADRLNPESKQEFIMDIFIKKPIEKM